MNRVRVAVAGLLLGVSACQLYAAEPPYPNRPIRFIVPFAPGGPSDILSRLVGAKLGENLGQTVVVDNRGAVGGLLGAELGAKAPPDGYSLLLSANSLLTINPHVYKKLAYDPQRDLQPITQLTSGGIVVVVHPSVQANTMKELIELAKAQPGKINFATTGTNNLLATEYLSLKAGIKMTAIPYKGTGQAVIDLVGGQVQLFFMNPLVAVPNVKAGKLRALAVTTLDRNSALPDVPTVAEAAVPGFQAITWHSVLAPAGIPRPILHRLNAELVKIVHSADVKERFTQQGLKAVGSSPEELRALIKQESAEYAKVVKEIGLQPQ
jgi:tripartite-type tricarboxylate transporter receptor subunit TctC